MGSIRSEPKPSRLRPPRRAVRGARRAHAPTAGWVSGVRSGTATSVQEAAGLAADDTDVRSGLTRRSACSYARTPQLVCLTGALDGCAQYTRLARPAWRV